MVTDSYIDWTGCELVPDTIVQDYELGESIEEIQEGFPALSAEQIQRLIEFAQSCSMKILTNGCDRSA